MLKRALGLLTTAVASSAAANNTYSQAQSETRNNKPTYFIHNFAVALDKSPELRNKVLYGDNNDISSYLKRTVLNSGLLSDDMIVNNLDKEEKEMARKSIDLLQTLTNKNPQLVDSILKKAVETGINAYDMQKYLDTLQTTEAKENYNYNLQNYGGKKRKKRTIKTKRRKYRKTMRNKLRSKI